EDQLSPCLCRDFDLCRIEAVDGDAQALRAQGTHRVADLGPCRTRFRAQVDHIRTVSSISTSRGQQLLPRQAGSMVNLREQGDIVTAILLTRRSVRLKEISQLAQIIWPTLD